MLIINIGGENLRFFGWDEGTLRDDL